MSAFPHNVEAEECVIGSLLMSRGTFNDVLDALDPSDFYVPLHRQLFDAAIRLAPSEVVVDALVLAHEAGVESRVVRSIADRGTTASWREYARIVRRCGEARRVMALGIDLQEAGSRADMDTAHRLIAEGVERVVLMPDVVLPPRSMRAILATDIADDDFIVPNLLVRGDRTIITGGEGHGKSTFIAMLAASFAAGLHPFDHTPMLPLAVYQLDCENSPRQIRRMGIAMRGFAGDDFIDNWLVDDRRAGVDLTRRNDQAWLEAKVAQVDPDVIVLGPLYKLFRGTAEHSKHSEEAAEVLTAFLDRLCARHNCALVMEAHAPYGEGGDRAGFRVAGSSLWNRWPEFIFGMKQIDATTYEMVRPREMRDRDRRWPTHIEHAEPWPWEGTFRTLSADKPRRARRSASPDTAPTEAEADERRDLQ